MVHSENIIKAIIKEFAAIEKGARHYIGRLPEKPKSPAFLYLLIFEGNSRNSYTTTAVRIDLQIIYFGEKDDYGKEKIREQMGVAHRLKDFLNRFYVAVEDRVLSFSYELGRADEHLTIDMLFLFRDSCINPALEEAEKMEAAETVHFRERMIT